MNHKILKVILAAACICVTSPIFAMCPPKLIAQCIGGAFTLGNDATKVKCTSAVLLLPGKTKPFGNHLLRDKVFHKRNGGHRHQETATLKGYAIGGQNNLLCDYGYQVREVRVRFRISIAQRQPEDRATPRDNAPRAGHTTRETKSPGYRR